MPGSEEIKKEDNDDQKVRINFNADIITAQTRSENSSPIDIDKMVTIYAYTSGSNSQLSSSVSYKSETAGTLSPVTSPMELPTVDYSLYAAGVNTVNSAVPVFTDGYATDIQNGLDYVWEGIWNIDVTDASDTINLVMSHCCTELLVDLVVESSITVDSISSVTITPPILTGIKWSLFNSGTIDYADSINANTSNMVDMGFTKTDHGFRAAYVMVPINFDTIPNLICNNVFAVSREGYP